MATFYGGFDRNRKGTQIEQLFLTLFHTNIKCKRIILGSQHNNIKQRYISQSIIENILNAVYLSVLLLK